MANNSAWTEPVVIDATNKPQYPYNNISQTKSGHSFEMDDTPKKERVRVQHRVGTFLEMQPNGDEVHKIYGNGYEIIFGDKNVKIKGQCNITIDGACVVNIVGDSVMNVQGDSIQYVKGDVTQTVDGAVKVTCKDDMDLTSKGDITMSAQNLYVNADLAVRGGITSTTSISAVNNVTAGKQGYAKLGFVTPGYISAGSPLPWSVIPGAIVTSGGISAGLPVPLTAGVPGSIISTVYMQSKLGNFGAMNALPAYGGTGIAKATAVQSLTYVTDAVRSMAGDRAIFNMHAHSAVKGGGDTSGPTTIPE